MESLAETLLSMLLGLVVISVLIIAPYIIAPCIIIITVIKLVRRKIKSLDIYIYIYMNLKI